MLLVPRATVSLALNCVQLPANFTLFCHSRQPTGGADILRTGGTRHQSTQINFEDTKAAFEGTTTPSLLGSYATLKLCGFDTFVSNADALWKTSIKFLGSRTTCQLLKHTFYKQFCAGAIMF
jgi:hypothetical protein